MKTMLSARSCRGLTIHLVPNARSSFEPESGYLLEADACDIANLCAQIHAIRAAVSRVWL